MIEIDRQIEQTSMFFFHKDTIYGRKRQFIPDATQILLKRKTEENKVNMEEYKNLPGFFE